tara:strand:+ start:97402 stop:99582 length:2181 start_codon:yes stop_codon:yes gene_type:complete
MRLKHLTSAIASLFIAASGQAAEEAASGSSGGGLGDTINEVRSAVGKGGSGSSSSSGGWGQVAEKALGGKSGSSDSSSASASSGSGGLAGAASGLLGGGGSSGSADSSSGGASGGASGGGDLQSKAISSVGNYAGSLISSTPTVERIAYRSQVVYLPRLELDGAVGNPFSAGGDAMFPLISSNHSIFYADVLTNFDTNNRNIFSGGLGYRHLGSETEMIWGLYGFFDYGKSKQNEYYPQATAGFEIMSNIVDFNVNAYIPVGTTEKQTGTYVTPVSTGHKLNLQTTNQFDTALAGVDTEIGFKVIPSLFHPLRAYVGYYHYGFGSVPKSINGAKLRLEQTINYSVRLFANMRYDAVFDAEWQLGVRWYIGGVRQSQEDYNSYDALRSRMMDVVPRNRSITTVQSDQVVDANSDFDVYYVNKNIAAGGTGTVENPFHTIDDALTQAKSGDKVYIYDGSYTMADDLSIAAGVSLMGSGSALQDRGYTFIAQGDAPTLNFTTTGKAVTLAEGSGLAGLNLSNATTEGSGVYVNAKNVTVSEVNTSKFKYGFEVDSATDTVTFDNVNATGAIALGGAGLHVADTAKNITVKNSTFSNNYRGVTLLQASNVTLDTVSANNNVAAPDSSGIYINGAKGVTLDNITAFGNGDQLGAATSGASGIDILTGSEVTLGSINAGHNGRVGVDIESGATVKYDADKVTGEDNGLALSTSDQAHDCLILKDGTCVKTNT